MNKADLWNYCAVEYDAVVPAITEPCIVKLLEQVLLLPVTATNGTVKVIDLAAGPGFLAAILGEAYSQAGLFEKMTILSTDFSSTMVEIAERHFASRNWSPSQFSARTLDATNLVDVPSNHYTHAFCTFGVIMIPDAPKALSEMHRVLQPLGIVGITSWEKVGWMPIVTECIARVKASSTKDGSSALPTSLLHGWSDKSYVQKVLEDAGFQNVQASTFESRWSFANHDECVKHFTHGRIIDSFLQSANMTAEEREKYNQIVHSVLLDMVNKKPEEPFHVPMVAILAHGRKPIN